MPFVGEETVKLGYRGGLNGGGGEEALTVRTCRKEGGDVLRVPGDVGGEVEFAARFELGEKAIERGGLHEPMLGVAFLGPRIGELDVDLVEACWGNGLADNLTGIAAE